MNALGRTGEIQAFDLMIEGRHFKNWMVWSTVNGVPNDRGIREKAEEYIWNKAGHNLGFITGDNYRWRIWVGTIERRMTAVGCP